MALTEALRLIVSADTRGAVQGIEKLGGTADRELGRSTKTIDKWGHGLTKAGAGMVTFGAVAVAGLLQAGQAASDLNEVASKSATVFGNANEKVDDFADSAAKIGLSKKAALEAASGFGNMFNQLGIAQDAAADMSIQITQLASDFASFHNADITEVLEAQSAAFRGEYDSIQRFLPLLSAATVEQRAMALTGKESKDTLTAQDKALAVHKLMLEGAGKAQGDFERTSDSAANQQRILAAEFENVKASLGQGVLPVMKTFLGVANDLVGGLADLNAMTDGTLGKVATFGAVGLIAVGGISALVGKVITMRENLSTAAHGVSSLTGKLGGLGRVAGVAGIAAGVAGVAFALNEIANARQAAELDSLAKDFLKIGDASDEAGQKVIRQLDQFGKVEDVFERILEKDVVAAEGFIDLAEAAGISKDAIAEMRDAVEDKRDADIKASANQEEYTEQVREGAEAMQTAAPAAKTLEERLDEQAEATKKAKDELDALNDALDAVLGRFLSVDQALAGQNTKILEVGEHFKTMREEHGRGAFALDVTTEAGIRNTEMLDGIVESAAKVIETMRDEGATEQEIQAQWANSRGQLQGVLDQFRRNGVEVGKYDELLRAVDNEVRTRVSTPGLASSMGQLGELKRKYDNATYRVHVEVKATQRGGINIGGGVRVFHEGGVVPGSRGQEVAAVLQAGEEVLSLDSPRNIANARHVAPVYAAAGGGWPGRSAVVQIDLTGGDNELMRWLRNRIRVENGGDVQLALGKGKR